MLRIGYFVVFVLFAACGGTDDTADGPSEASMSGSTDVSVISLWEEGTPAFGIFVPSERDPGARDADGNRMPPLYTVEGARMLADEPLLDYLFLNLEGSYDPEAVRILVAGLDAGTTDHRPTLLVRLPTIADAGADATRTRVAEVLSLGADGVVIPHVRSPEEARLAVEFFEEAGADVWSPANPDGTIVAMLMVEDPGAIGSVEEIVAVPGYSMLSCGIGSLTGAMDGDREGAEAACQNVRDVAAMAGMPSMMTANANSIADRIEQGYLGLLLSGSVDEAADVIRTGREIAGRPTM
ncbi:MAG: aldolase/citrate lyase family protein [Gemmatimonadota bacterium]